MQSDPLAGHFSTLVEALPDAIYFKDGAGRWRVANAAGLQLLGLLGQAWEGKTSLELAKDHPHLADALTSGHRNDERTWELAKRCNFLEPAPRPDDFRVFSIAKIPLFNSDGSRQGMVVIAHEYTDRAKEPALDTANKMLLKMLNGLECIVYAVDLQTHRIIFVNRYAEQSLHKQIKVGGTCWEEVKCGKEETCSFSHELCLPEGSGTEPGGHAWEYQNTDNLRWYHVQDSAIRWIDGRLARLEIATDITERKALETRHKRRQENMYHAARVSVAGEMASGLAHEISQPLAAARTYLEGCVELIDSGRHDMAQLGEGIKTAHAQIERAGNIIAQLRNFMRKGRSDRPPININQLISSSIHFLNHEFQTHRIHVSLELSDPPPIRANPVELEQVLVNLMKNAIDSMQHSPVRKLEIRTRQLESALEVAISDTGKGIPESEIGRIFNPFTTSKEDSLGLGLTICQSIVESYGGGIKVLSSPDSGTTFSFTLPKDSHA